MQRMQAPIGKEGTCESLDPYEEKSVERVVKEKAARVSAPLGAELKHEDN